MAYIQKKDTDGTKAILLKGELGYDDYTAGGDTGRVYVGNGTTNEALSKKAEVDTALGLKADKANPIFTGSITEQTAVATTVLEPDNGTVQTKTLSANTTFTDGLADGQFLTLIVANAGFTITYPTITWWGSSEPVLGTTDKLFFEKIGSTLYGTHSGSI